jgi:hypothetical protein
MPEGEQDHGAVAMAMSIVAGHLHQALDLLLGEVLARA